MADAEWEAELAPYAERVQMCLAEAGYPRAEVEIGPSGVFASGAPWDVICRAYEVSDHPQLGRRG